MNLTEQLTVLLIKTLLAAMLLAAVCAAYHSAKLWIIGCYAYHENQIETFLSDHASEGLLLSVTTNKCKKWSVIKIQTP